MATGTEVQVVARCDPDREVRVIVSDAGDLATGAPQSREELVLIAGCHVSRVLTRTQSVLVYEAARAEVREE
jgi:hypothetical protein